MPPGDIMDPLSVSTSRVALMPRGIECGPHRRNPPSGHSTRFCISRGFHCYRPGTSLPGARRRQERRQAGPAGGSPEKMLTPRSFWRLKREVVVHARSDPHGARYVCADASHDPRACGSWSAVREALSTPALRGSERICARPDREQRRWQTSIRPNDTCLSRPVLPRRPCRSPSRTLTPRARHPRLVGCRHLLVLRVRMGAYSTQHILFSDSCCAQNLRKPVELAIHAGWRRSGKACRGTHSAKQSSRRWHAGTQPKEEECQGQRPQ